MVISLNQILMNKTFLALIISLIASIAIAFLMYSAGVEPSLVKVLFVVSTTANFFVIWIFLEFVIYRDLVSLTELLLSFLKGDKSKDLKTKSLNLKVSKKIHENLCVLQKRKENEIAQLIERANFRSQFIADISHELKTPIFTAQGYIHTLLDGAMEDEEVRYKFLQKSARSLDFLDKLVRDLLELSQIETGNIVLMCDHFDIIPLVDEIIEDFEQQADKTEVSIKRSKKPPESIVYADYVRIRQVMQNLISNAIKYNIEGGKIRIKIIESIDNVEIRVADTGIGIPAPDLPKIFTRFYRVDKSRTKIRKKTSNGLGLAIVKHLLDSHNSSIQVKSKVGKGSVFSFSLQKDKLKLDGKRPQIEALDII